jgi:sugar/nucleoside kinase (ribokinase family)
MSEKIDLVMLGEILIDMFPAELGRGLAEVSAFFPKPGGGPANAAVAAARLGVRCAFIGKVGEDAFGRHLIQVMAHEGVETGGMRVDPSARTTMAFIAKPDENTAEFVFYRNPGADTLLREEELDRELLSGARALHFGSLNLTDEPTRGTTLEAIRLARLSGALVSFDVNYRPSLWPSPEIALQRVKEVIPLVDMLKVNEVELELLAASQSLQAAARSLLALGPRLCVVTLGQQGSYFQLAEAGGRVGTFPVRTVDAVGCGDAFIAGLLSRLIHTGDWRDQLHPDRLAEALRYANAVGAITATTQGVIPALPYAAQVEDFLREHSGA